MANTWVTPVMGGDKLQVTDGGGGASNSGTNLALASFWHQS